MIKELNRYKWLSVAAVVIFLALLLIQIVWLNSVIKFNQAEQQLKLKQLIPDLAIEINGLGHNYFHGNKPPLKTIEKSKITEIISDFMQSHLVYDSVHYAIFQEINDTNFISNNNIYDQDLLDSEIKSCMSCIISFSISKGIDRRPDESDSSYMNRVVAGESFEYYSPVNKLVDKGKDIVWLTLYQPYSAWSSLRSLWYLFVAGILLNSVLLGLFYYLLRSLANYKRLTKIKDDFFNNMTHEFKTPLSSIRLAATVLRKNKHPEKNIDYYNVIAKESKLLESQVDKLLALSLLDNQQLEMQKQEISLDNFQTAIASRMSPLLEEKNAQLIFELNQTPKVIWGDFIHLQNCICNLIENSVKYGADKIIIKIQQNNEKLSIGIKDNGPGIDPEIQPYIFDRFYRGQKGNQYKTKGFGIGLSYVKSVIHNHGGQIKLINADKDGTEFQIQL